MIVPDSDVWTRPDLLQPVFALGKELEGRGAKVAVLKLPSGSDGTKVGPRRLPLREFARSIPQLADLRARYGGAADVGEDPDDANPVSSSGSHPVTSGASGDDPHKQ